MEEKSIFALPFERPSPCPPTIITLALYNDTILRITCQGPHFDPLLYTVLLQFQLKSCLDYTISRNWTHFS